MINYKEKGAGLHDKIREYGYQLYQHNGEWFSSYDPGVQVLVDGYTLEEAAAYVEAKIDALAKKKRDKVVEGVSPAEMASWTIKRNEAAGYAGVDTSAPMLAIEAAARGVPTQVIVNKVNAKATALATLEAQIAGVAGKHADAVKALNSFAAISNYDYTTGWPV